VNQMRITVSDMAALGLLMIGMMAVPAAKGGEGQASPSQFDGHGLYRSYCASCHGETGRGDGPIAAHLKPRPADLTQIAKRNKGTFSADRVAELIDGRQMVKPHGNSQMPVWGDAFSKTTNDSDVESVKGRIAALVTYLQSIQERPAP
jgi:mono/diheme cytochrome c family protein